MIRAFIQARMNSSRFPGKVLAPLRGRPLIHHVIHRVSQVIPQSFITVVTSTERTDDPLAFYVAQIGTAVFRGPLHDVFQRFRLCVLEFPCEWILRINADSPLLNAENIRSVIAYAENGDFDLITTTFPRTLPKGQNVELIRVGTFMKIDAGELSANDKEHVTPFFYRHPERFRIKNVALGKPQLAELSLAVDTVDDLKRLEQFPENPMPAMGSQ